MKLTGGILWKSPTNSNPSPGGPGLPPSGERLTSIKRFESGGLPGLLRAT